MAAVLCLIHTLMWIHWTEEFAASSLAPHGSVLIFALIPVQRGKLQSSQLVLEIAVARILWDIEALVSRLEGIRLGNAGHGDI